MASFAELIIKGSAGQAIRSLNETRTALERTNREARHSAAGFRSHNSELARASRGAIAGSGAFRHLGRSIAFASGTFLGVAGFVDAVRASIHEATDLNSQMVRSSVVFGRSGKDVREWSKTADHSLALARDGALKAANAFGTMLTAMGVASPVAGRLSESITKVAAAISLTRGESDPARAIQAITVGLAGRGRALRQYGIILDETGIKAEALRLGLVKSNVDLGKVKDAQLAVAAATAKHEAAMKSWGQNSTQAAAATISLHNAQRALEKQVGGTAVALTNQQKAQAAASLIITQGARFTNNYGRLLDTTAGRQRRFRQGVNELQEEIGGFLLPQFNRIITRLSDYMSTLQEGGRRHAAFVRTMTRITNGLDEVGRTARTAGRFLMGVIDTVGGFGNAFHLILGGYIAVKLLSITRGARTLAAAMLLVRGRTAAAGATMGTFATETEASMAASEIAVRGLSLTIKSALISTGLGALIVAMGLAAEYTILHWHRVKRWFQIFGLWMKEWALKTALDAVEPFSHLPGRLGGWARRAKDHMEAELNSTEWKARLLRSGAAAGDTYGKAWAAAANAAIKTPGVEPGSRTTRTPAQPSGGRGVVGASGAGAGFIPSGGGFSLRRRDQGHDFVTTPGGSIIAPGAGYVVSVNNDPGGFGPDYPVVHFTSGRFKGQTLYIGHTHSALSSGQRFAQGATIAHTDAKGGIGSATTPGWVEIGYWPPVGHGKIGRDPFASVRGTPSPPATSPAGGVPSDTAPPDLHVGAHAPRAPRHRRQTVSARSILAEEQRIGDVERRVRQQERAGNLSDRFAASVIARLNRLLARLQKAHLTPTQMQRITHSVQQLWQKINDAVSKGVEAARKKAAKLAEAHQKAIDAAEAAADRARTKFEGVWERMAGRVLDAFDRVTQNGLDAINAVYDALTPAEQALKALQDARAAADRGHATEDAQSKLRRALEIGDPEMIKEAQRELEQARLDEQEAALQAQAEIERAARDKEREAAIREYQDQRDIQRQHLQDMLDDLEAKLGAGTISWADALNQIKAIIGANIGEIGTLGGLIGQNFVAAMVAELESVGGAVGAVVKAFGKLRRLGYAWDPETGEWVRVGSGGGGGAPPNPPGWGAHHDPDQHLRWMQHGGIVRRPTVVGVGEGGPEAIVPLNRLRGLGGGGDIHVHLPRYLGDRREVVDDLRIELRKLAKGLPGGVNDLFG